MTPGKLAEKYHTDDVSLLGASDWLRQLYLGTQDHQIRVMTLHQLGVSALDPQALFREETGSRRGEMSADLSGYTWTNVEIFEVLLFY